MLATTIPLSIDGMADERWVRLAEQQGVAYAKTVAEAMKLKLDMDNPADREKLRRTALERHDPTRMPLSRPINHPHPTASDFFENLVIPEKPIPILTLDIAEQMIQSWLDRRMFAVTVNPPGEKGTSDKTAPYARYGPASCADARLILKMQRDRTSGRTHAGIMSINRGSANANSQIFEKLFTSDFASQAENKLRKFNG